jgi:hypothetical protein
MISGDLNLRNGYTTLRDVVGGEGQAVVLPDQSFVITAIMSASSVPAVLL